jgi:hypothetical protein
MLCRRPTPSITIIAFAYFFREMIFNIPKTIAYLSAGTTLEAGSLIMVILSDMTANFRLEPVLELEFSANHKSC